MNTNCLQDITGRESGVVLYPESKEAIICNWSSINGMPRIAPFGLCVLGFGEELITGDNIPSYELSDYTCICDDNNTWKTIEEQSIIGTYFINGAIVLTFLCWN